MAAPLGARQHQGQGFEFQMLLKRGAMKMRQLFRLLLVLLDPAKIVLHPVGGREKSLVAQRSCLGDLKFPVLQLAPRGDPS